MNALTAPERAWLTQLATGLRLVMDSGFKRRVERLEEPEAKEAKWQANAEARARVRELVALVRKHMGPDERSSVAEYVEKHVPEEPSTDIDRAMFVLKDGIQRAKERRAW